MDGPDWTLSLMPKPLLSNPSKTSFHTASSAVGPHTPVARTTPSSTPPCIRDGQTDRARHSGHPRVAVCSERRRVHLLRAAVPATRYDLVVQEGEIALVRGVPERVSQLLREGVRRRDGPTCNGLFGHCGGY